MRITSSIALMALNKALRATPSVSARRASNYSSRTADKFVIRAFEELFENLDESGMHHGRSRNAEVVDAVFEALNGNARVLTLLKALKSHLGDELAEKVLAGTPNFKLSECEQPAHFVLRLPPNVRDTIRSGVKWAMRAQGCSDTSMNEWFLSALERWVNLQRQYQALLTTAISLDQNVLNAGFEHDAGSI